jgi:hypothetical protein
MSSAHNKCVSGSVASMHATHMSRQLRGQRLKAQKATFVTSHIALRDSSIVVHDLAFGPEGKACGGIDMGSDQCRELHYLTSG